MVTPPYWCPVPSVLFFACSLRPATRHALSPISSAPSLFSSIIRAAAAAVGATGLDVATRLGDVVDANAPWGARRRRRRLRIRLPGIFHLVPEEGEAAQRGKPALGSCLFCIQSLSFGVVVQGLSNLTTVRGEQRRKRIVLQLLTPLFSPACPFSPCSRDGVFWWCNTLRLIPPPALRCHACPLKQLPVNTANYLELEGVSLSIGSLVLVVIPYRSSLRSA